MQEHDVFLSYSREDTAMMQRLRDDLRQAGLRVWTDEGIPVGSQSWKLEIEQAIRSARCLVVILSPDATASRWVRAEIDYAEAQGKQLFPVLARGDEREAVPFGLSSHQWIDLRDASQYPKQFQRLTAALARELDGEQVQQAAQFSPAALAPPSTAQPPVSPSRPALIAGGLALLLLVALGALFLPGPLNPVPDETAIVPTPTLRVIVDAGGDASAGDVPAEIETPALTLPEYEPPEDWRSHSTDLLRVAAPSGLRQLPVDSEVFVAFIRFIEPNYEPGQGFATLPTARFDLYLSDVISTRGVFFGVDDLNLPLTSLDVLGARVEVLAEDLNFDVVNTTRVRLPAGEMIRHQIESRREDVPGQGVVYSMGIDEGTRHLFVLFAVGGDSTNAEALLTLSEQVMGTFELVGSEG